MCGIYGEVTRGAPTRRPLHEEATDRLAHRGPDGRGTWASDGVFLGMRRLSVIDLASGDQPIWNEDGTCCIVYNGELYNYRQLRSELIGHGHVFRTQSDTEVVLHAYEQWGSRCLDRFNGMFGFAVWDSIRRSLFVARDRIGEKPVHYYWDGTRFRFASEIKAILADRSIPRRINHRGLANYLAFGHSLAPETMYEGVCKLLPGHYLVLSDGAPRVVRYWDLDPEPPVSSPRSQAAWAEEVLTLLEDSVRRRMVADVPIGAFLSGGVDSSAVVALMSRYSTPPVKTFSLGFRATGYNELSDARGVATYFGTDHHELEVGPDDLLDALPALAEQFDEPFADAAAFPVYLLSRAARHEVKVVLTGDGGDELFGGYRRYVAEQVAATYQRLPRQLTERWLPALVGRLPRLRRTKRMVAALAIADAARRYPAWLRVFDPAVQTELLRPDVLDWVRDDDPGLEYSGHYAALPSQDHLNRLMYVDLKTWLPDDYLEKTDKATMSCGLEARIPLLDHRLIELAFRIPSVCKIRGTSTKRVLKEAVRTLLPPAVLEKSKRGFSVPTDPWFRGELKSFAFEVLTDDRTVARGIFEPRAVRQLWNEHMNGRHVRDSQLWSLLNFELWCREYLDSTAA